MQIENFLLKKILKMNESNDKSMLKTWSKKSTIYPEFIGHTLAVYNGRKHISIYISENMVGHKLGEFVFTRMFKGHPKK